MEPADRGLKALRRICAFRTALATRRSGLVMVVALGVLALLVVPGVLSATDATLVKNTAQVSELTHNGETLHYSMRLERDFPKRAQAFTTGSNAAGYNLSSIGVKFDDIFTENMGISLDVAKRRLTVTVNTADSDDNPGSTAHCTLTHPASYARDAVNFYGVPSSCNPFTANTTYFVVVAQDDFSDPGYIELRLLHSGDEDAGAATGWSVGDFRRYYSANDREWQRGFHDFHCFKEGVDENTPGAVETTNQFGETAWWLCVETPATHQIDVVGSAVGGI